MEYISTKPHISEAVKSWKKYSSTFNYHFYTDAMCETFIKNNCDEGVYSAYMRLPLAVMKADLWRYCVVYKYGGIYADTDTICNVDPSCMLKQRASLVIVPENSIHLCQWVFAAPAGSPILKSIIDLTVKRILETPTIKGDHIVHYLTGPGVFTDAIEMYLRKKRMRTFSDRLLYTKYPYSFLYVFDSSFHIDAITHLFSGQDSDGWCKERVVKLG